MELIDITRATIVTYQELCNFFHTNFINGRSKKANEERKQQVEYMRSLYNGEIKYNEKKRNYTIVPNLNKHDIKAQQIKQKAKDKGTLIITHDNREIIATAKNAITQTKFRDYILYIASNFYGDTKAQFYLMCLHPIAFYNRIFNNHYLHDDIDGFTYLVQKSNYSSEVLINGRDIIFNRLGSYVSKALKYWIDQNYIDVFEYYITNENHKLSLDEVRKYTQLALNELKFPSENIALEINKEKFLETRDKYFQQDIKDGKINYLNPNQFYLKIIDRKFQVFKTDKFKQMIFLQDKEYYLNILEDFCKVIQNRFTNDINNKKIIIAQDKKAVKVGYKLEQQIYDCYFPYLILDRESFINPIIFQQQNKFENYSIYIMKIVDDKTKIDKIVQYRWGLRQQINKGKELI